ncbi:MAG: hypothetical protein RIQ49_2496 [Pseudomonadota bacterium]
MPDQLNRYKIHCRRPNKTCYEFGPRSMVELLRCTHLFDHTMIHNNHPIGQCHRFHLIMGHVHRGGSNLLMHLLDLCAHLHSELGIQIR